ncbi:hypothetical protein RFZ45_10455, partial [Acinetobacter baumannii]|nr:hypothetical protein [Acinetobacter baumannii]
MMGTVTPYAAEEETALEEAAEETDEKTEEADASEDEAAAQKAAELIDKIYVQERTETTDADCAAAKEAWDALTDAQKE